MLNLCRYFPLVMTVSSCNSVSVLLSVLYQIYRMIFTIDSSGILAMLCTVHIESRKKDTIKQSYTTDKYDTYAIYEE